MPVFVSKFVRAIVPVVYYVFLLPVMLLVSLVRPFKVAVLKYERIGHLAYDTDLYRRRREVLSGADRPPRVVFVSSTPANRYLLDMWKRKLSILESVTATRLFFALRAHLERTGFLYQNAANGREHYEFSVADPLSLFTPDEHRRGRAFLKRMGLGEDDWFVCMHARTGAYLNAVDQNKNWSYHDFRDARIENYLPAAEHVTSKGGFVFRMGTSTEAPLEDNDNPRIIDYATRHHDDFLDIYLSAMCRFFIASSSGVVCLPLLFNKPVVATNYIPYRYIGIGARAVYMPKLLRHAEDDSLVTFSELYEKGAFRTDTTKTLGGGFYADQKYEWIENDGDDILCACMDMFDRIEGRPAPEKGAALSMDYKRFLRGTTNDSEYGGMLSPRFAEKYASLFQHDLSS